MSVPKLRFKEFDGDWKIKKLGNSFNLISGYAFPSSASVDKGAKWLKIADVGIQEMTPSSLSYLPHEFLEKYPQFIVSKDDYVIALTRPILNKKLKIAKVGNSYDGALLNQRVAKIQTNENDLGFIYSLLQKSKTVEELENSISGTDPPNLSLNDVKDIRLGFPSIEEQTKIASFLSAVDEKINQLTQKHQLLSQYKQGMMQKLFSQQIRFKADDGSEFGEWESKKISDLFYEVRNKVADRDIETYSITAGKGFVSQADKFGRDISGKQNSNYIVIKPNDFSYNKGNSKTYKYGCVYLNELNYDIAVPNVFISFRSKKLNLVHEKFYSKLFEFHYLDRYLRLLISSSARMDGLLNVSKDSFFEIKLPYPCLEEQTKIANFLSAIDQKIDVVSEQLEQAKLWKKGLLQQMFV